MTQFRLAHFLAPAGRAVLEEELPEVFGVSWRPALCAWICSR